jgi:hypothetical protein
MLPPRQPNSDRSPESLAAQLRALPAPAVPGDLEARLLAAIPPEAVKSPRLAHTPRRLAFWTCAGVAAAAALIAVLLWQGIDSKNPDPSPAVNVVNSQPDREITPDRPESFSITPWLKAAQELDRSDGPVFAWPIQEKPRVMAWSAMRPDLLD